MINASWLPESSGTMCGWCRNVCEFAQLHRAMRPCGLSLHHQVATSTVIMSRPASSSLPALTRLLQSACAVCCHPPAVHPARHCRETLPLGRQAGGSSPPCPGATLAVGDERRGRHEGGTSAKRDKVNVGMLQYCLRKGADDYLMQNTAASFPLLLPGASWDMPTAPWLCAERGYVCPPSPPTSSSINSSSDMQHQQQQCTSDSSPHLG